MNVRARDRTGSRCSAEARTTRWPELVASVGAALAVGVVARSRYLRLGATDEEVGDPMPGDGLVPDADLIATRAGTIHAVPGEVWPWLAQIGQGRGGLYSYDWAENLVGCDMHSADRIEPAWQDVHVGDEVRLHPEIPLTVAEVDPDRALVLSGGVPAGGSAPPYEFAWAFVLVPAPDDAMTRLVIRERYAYTRRWAPLVVEPVAAISSVMTRRMLRGIAERAERQQRSWPA
jgi:hypothetical protein